MRCPSYVRGWDPTANGGAGAWQERIYYAGSATSFAGPYTIGYLEWDGARWVRQGRAPVFTATEPWEKPTVAEPNVIYSDGRWRMWYLAGPDKAKQFLQGYAESPDGRTDWKKRIYWPGEQNVFDHNSRAHKSNDEKGREMSSGIDCSTSTLGQAHCIKQAGFDFVVRYLPLGLDKSLSRQ